MQNKSLVSVITPAYNAAKTLSRTIESVRQQSHSNWELIVIDDGSIDTTRSVVESYCVADNRIKYLYQENGRQGKARNTGLRAANGTYVAFLDADDIWLPQKLELQLDKITSSAAELVFTDAYVFRTDQEAERELDKLGRMNIAPATYEGEEGLNKFLIYNRVPTLTVLARKDAIFRAGCFTEYGPVQNAEDFHLWIKMLINGCIFIGMEAPLALYRKHDASVSDASGSNHVQVIEAKLALIKEFPLHQQLITDSLPITIGYSLSEVSKWDDGRFYDTISYYLSLLNKKAWSPLFAGYRLLKLRALSARSFYFIINHL